jgi:hypothetical protein
VKRFNETSFPWRALRRIEVSRKIASIAKKWQKWQKWRKWQKVAPNSRGLGSVNQ